MKKLVAILALGASLALVMVSTMVRQFAQSDGETVVKGEAHLQKEALVPSNLCGGGISIRIGDVEREKEKRTNAKAKDLKHTVPFRGYVYSPVRSSVDVERKVNCRNGEAPVTDVTLVSDELNSIVLAYMSAVIENQRILRTQKETRNSLGDAQPFELCVKLACGEMNSKEGRRKFENASGKDLEFAENLADRSLLDEVSMTLEGRAAAKGISIDATEGILVSARSVALLRSQGK